MTAAAKISACIVCRNEADKLVECLESLSWVDEIVVMDLESSDPSVTVAQQYGALVVSRSACPIVEPLRNEIASIAHGTWILAIDPDERVTPGLATELRRLANEHHLDAVVVPRMNWDLGFPPSSEIQRYEPQLRMYRRSAVQWPTVPNTLPIVPAERRHVLPHRDDLVLVHQRSRNVPEILDRSVRYSPAQAQSMLDQGQVFSARGLLAALWKQSEKEFLKGEAWRDGVPGLLRVGILVGFKFYVWVAFWQLSGARRTPEDDRLVRRLGVLLNAAYRLVLLAARGHRLVRRILHRLWAFSDTTGK